jgi:uncharacterized protein YkwD
MPAMDLRSSLRALITLALAGVLAGCSGNAACDCGPSIANPLDADENAIVQQLNIARMNAGVGTVKACFTLNVSAAGHSDDMRDNNYLNDVSPVDGSTVRTRACTAGYKAACGTSIPMAELVAEGNGTGTDTFAQWSTDAMSSPILLEKGYVVVGVGQSRGLQNEYWALDLSSVADPSCSQ